MFGNAGVNILTGGPGNDIFSVDQVVKTGSLTSNLVRT